MRIGDLRDAWGKFMPNGSVQTTADGQPIHLGIAQITGQAQTFLCDDGTTRQGLSMRFFLDSAEFVCPADLAKDAPAGTKAPPTPPGAMKIGQKSTFAKAYLLDQKYGSPRELDPSGKTVANFGSAIVTGRDKVVIAGVITQVWCFRQDLLKLEWCSPV
jgi:hypothetical protein